MPDYRVLGGVLRSCIEIPGLSEVRSVPDRHLRRVDRLPTVDGLEHVGREPAAPGVDAVLYRHPGGFRLTFGTIAAFDISVDGREILWCPPTADPKLDLVRQAVLGRGLALALHQRGDLALHGSAVAFARHSVAFIAPKFHGKSTTVSALVRAGGRLLADDLVAVDVHAEPPTVLPGVPVVKLRQDSARSLRSLGLDAPTDIEGGKVELHLEPGPDTSSPIPLAAVYLLAPVEDDDGAVVHRRPLEGKIAALTLAAHAKVGGLLDGKERSAQLDAAVALSRATDVFTLEVPRNLDRLPEVVGALLEWHGP